VTVSPILLHFYPLIGSAGGKKKKKKRANAYGERKKRRNRHARVSCVSPAVSMFPTEEEGKKMLGKIESEKGKKRGKERVFPDLFLRRIRGGGGNQTRRKVPWKRRRAFCLLCTLFLKGGKKKREKWGVHEGKREGKERRGISLPCPPLLNSSLLTLQGKKKARRARKRANAKKKGGGGERVCALLTALLSCGRREREKERLFRLLLKSTSNFSPLPQNASDNRKREKNQGRTIKKPSIKVPIGEEEISSPISLVSHVHGPRRGEKEEKKKRKEVKAIINSFSQEKKKRRR